MEAVEDEGSGQCENSECKVAETGDCIEGLDVSACTHYGKSVVVVHRSRPPAPPPEPAGIRLSSAEALSMSEAEALIRKTPANVIGIVGPHHAGKTSLISCLFDLFQRTTVSGFAFAGSTTLYAFERACHDTRRESGNRHALMERTHKGKATFLHLDLADSTTSAKRAILLANRAGEDYTDAQSDTKLAAGFFELQRSDTLTMLVDGERLLDLGARQQVRNDILLTLRALVEGGATRKTQQVAIVMTKIDVFRAAIETDRARAATFFESIVKDAKRQFSQEFLDIKSFEVAASPKGGGTTRGLGMEKLLSYWMAQPGRNTPQMIPSVELAPGRVFNRLTPAREEASND